MGKEDYVKLNETDLTLVKDKSLGKTVYTKNGNGNWYRGEIIDNSIWHTIRTVKGHERVMGIKIGHSGINIYGERCCGIYPDKDVYELNAAGKN